MICFGRRQYCAAILVALLLAPGARGQTPAPECRGTRSLLLALSRRDEHYKAHLSELFGAGDVCIGDLVAALDDPTFDVQVAAQEVIRYLGNEKGLKALNLWNSKTRESYPVWGPVPVPISEFDYQMIELHFVGQRAGELGLLGSRYFYALAIDDSPRAKAALAKAVQGVKACRHCSISNKVIELLMQAYPLKPFPCMGDVARATLEGAFFLAPEDKKRTSAQLLSFNAAKNKALVELRVDRGTLAEEWYHVVVSKQGSGWKFFSITFIAVS